jgi:hypothetical protein
MWRGRKRGLGDIGLRVLPFGIWYAVYSAVLSSVQVFPTTFLRLGWFRLRSLILYPAAAPLQYRPKRHASHSVMYPQLQQ